MLAAIGAWVVAAPALAMQGPSGFSKAEVGRVDRLLQFIQEAAGTGTRVRPKRDGRPCRNRGQPQRGRP